MFQHDEAFDAGVAMAYGGPENLYSQSPPRFN